MTSVFHAFIICPCVLHIPSISHFFVSSTMQTMEPLNTQFSPSSCQLHTRYNSADATDRHNFLKSSQEWEDPVREFQINIILNLPIIARWMRLSGVENSAWRSNHHYLTNTRAHSPRSEASSSRITASLSLHIIVQKNTIKALRLPAHLSNIWRSLGGNGGNRRRSARRRVWRRLGLGQ